MLDLLKRTFELWIKMRWLKEIEIATDESKKAYEKAIRKRYVLNELLKAYKEKYGEDLSSHGERKGE